MCRQPRRHSAAGFKEQAAACLSGPGATQAGVAGELGMTPPQLKGWRPELAAAGPAGAIRLQQAGAAAFRGRQTAGTISGSSWSAPAGRMIRGQAQTEEAPISRTGLRRC